MRSRFEGLTKKISKEFSDASWKVTTVKIPKSLKPVSSKDEVKK